MEAPRILLLKEKEALDNLIKRVSGMQDSEQRSSLFVKLLTLSGIAIDALVETHNTGYYQYLPVSIYMLVRIDDNAVSGAFFKQFGKSIAPDVLFPNGVHYRYVFVLYNTIMSYPMIYQDINKMTSAVFVFKDLSFLKEINSDVRGGSGRVVGFLECLYDEIDNYMDESKEREVFREEIKMELDAEKHALNERKKKNILEDLALIFKKVDELRDPEFTALIKEQFRSKTEEDRNEDGCADEVPKS